MTIFWILAAGLVGIALLFVILPLYTTNEAAVDELDQDQLNLAIFHQQIRELDSDLAAGNLDQEQYGQARHDLERELLKDVGDRSGGTEPEVHSTQKPSSILPVTLAVLVPALSVGLYLYTGQPDLIPRLTAVAQPGASAPGHVGSGQEMPPMEVLVQRLAERMEQNPEKLDGWLMLGRTYFAVDQPQKGVAAMARAYALAPQEPDVLVAYAEGIAMTQDSQLDGKPAELILAALQIDSTHASGRWLNGMLMYQRGQFSGAVTAWKSILAEMDPSSQEAAEMRDTIRSAQQRAGVPEDQLIAATAPQTSLVPATPTVAVAPSTTELPATTATQQVPQAEAAPASVQVKVTLDSSLEDRAAPDDTVFVYAKAVSGPPMPLAAQRLMVKDLPASITLDDSMAMMPQMRLSMFPQVTVGARITKSGQAIPQSGDLQGEVSPVSTSEAPTVDVLINTVRP